VPKARPYSYTRLFDVARCPWAFEQKYLKEKKEHNDSECFGPDPAGFGSAFHYLAEKLVSQLVKEKKRQDVELAQSLLDQLFDESKASLEIYDDLQRIFVTNYASRFEVNIDTFYDIEAPVAIDEEGDEVGWNDPNAFIRFKADYVEYDHDNKLLTIIDYKTNLGVPNWDTFWHSNFVKQLELYAWLSWKYLSKRIPDILEINVGNLFVRWGAWRGFKIYANQMPQIENRIMKRIERIENLKLFRAIPCSHCQYCEFLTTTCPVKSNIKQPIETDQAATSVLREIVYLKDKMAVRQKQLKEYVDRTEKTPKSGEYQMGYNPKTSTKFHSEDAVKILMENEVKLDPFISVNKTNLKTLDPEVQKALLDKASFNDESTRFELRKT
jgi:hypothetical protein